MSECVVVAVITVCTIQALQSDLCVRVFANICKLDAHHPKEAMGQVKTMGLALNTTQSAARVPRWWQSIQPGPTCTPRLAMYDPRKQKQNNNNNTLADSNIILTERKCQYVANVVEIIRHYNTVQADMSRTVRNT